MTEETSTPAATPASEHTMPAEALAQETYYEQPAEAPEHENYEEPAEGHEEPADLGEILEGRPKKLSGAQRAKLQREYLQNELREREQRIEALERHISQGVTTAVGRTTASATMVLTWSVSKTREEPSPTLMPQCQRWRAWPSTTT